MILTQRHRNGDEQKICKSILEDETNYDPSNLKTNLIPTINFYVRMIY